MGIRAVESTYVAPINGEPESNCAICLEHAYKAGDKLKGHDNHRFHKVCLDTWFAQEKNTCPLCKAVFANVIANPQNAIPRNHFSLLVLQNYGAVRLGGLLQPGEVRILLRQGIDLMLLAVRIIRHEAILVRPQPQVPNSCAQEQQLVNEARQEADRAYIAVVRAANSVALEAMHMINLVNVAASQRVERRSEFDWERPFQALEQIQGDRQEPDSFDWERPFRDFERIQGDRQQPASFDWENPFR